MTTSAVQAQTTPVSDPLPPVSEPAGGAVYRLSPAEIEAALASAAARNASRMPLLPPLPGAGLVQATPDAALRGGRPHGEVGMMIGSGGARAVWGSTMVPLGANGVAAFSFSTGRWPGVPY
ncbi:MAG: hypothetical protein ACRCUI_07500 [Polymorphobacter sp.]